MALRMLRAFLSLLWKTYVRRGEELEQFRSVQSAIAAENAQLRRQLATERNANTQFSRRATQDQARLDEAERIAARKEVMYRLVRDLTRVFRDALEGNDLDFEQVDVAGLRWRVTGYRPLEFFVNFDGRTVSVRNTNLTGRRALSYRLLSGNGLSEEVLIAIVALFDEVRLTGTATPGHNHADLFVDEGL